MKMPVISIVMFLVASLLGAIGQFLYKSGADSAGKTLVSSWRTGASWWGLVATLG